MIEVLWVQEDEESDPELHLGTTGYNWHSCRPAIDAECTLEAMADMLDLDAENHNAHAYVMSHRGLAAVLFLEIGRKAATRIMRRLAGYGGLHGMVGACGTGDGSAKDDLGVQLQDWSAWALPAEGGVS